MEHHVHLDNYQACRMCVERENEVERLRSENDAATLIIERLELLLREHVSPPGQDGETSSGNVLD